MGRKFLAGLLIAGLLNAGISTISVRAQENTFENGLETQEIGTEESEQNIPESGKDIIDEAEDVLDVENETGEMESVSEIESEAGETEDISEIEDETSETEAAFELETETVSVVETELEKEVAAKAVQENPFAEMRQVMIDEGWYTICVADNEALCLSIFDYSEDEGSQVRLAQTKSNLGQRFYIYVSDRSEGYYRIQNVASQKGLGIADKNINGSYIAQWQMLSDDRMEVAFYENAAGELIIRSKAGENLVFTIEGDNVAGAKLQLASYTGGHSQRFMLREWKIPGEEAEIADGIYKIYSAASSRFVLDVKSGSMSSGANVQLYQDNETGAQEWQITKHGSWYTIANVKSGKLLDIAGGSENSGVNVQQYNANYTNAQYFRFYKQADGNFYIMSKYGTVLDIKWASFRNGTNIQVYQMNDTDAQKWGLEKLTILAGAEKSLADGYYTIQSRSTGKVLANLTAESGGNTNLADVDGRDVQIYMLEKQSDGWYKMKNTASGYYLDASGSNLQQAVQNASNAQKFKFYSAGNGCYYIKSKLFTVIESDGSDIYMNKAAASEGQQWKVSLMLPKSRLINITAGDYIIRSAIDSSMAIDIRSASKESGANVQLYPDNNTNAQNFYISKTSDGWYTIQNNKSKMYLDVLGGSTKSGANLQQYTGNGSDAQKFRFYDMGNGQIVIQSKKGTVIDVSGGKAVARRNVQLYEYNSTKAQKWILKASARKRKYQNPPQYYQIQDKITLTGGGYNLSVGYEGLKTAWVIRRLGLGDAVGMGGAYYSSSVASSVKNFQKNHGLTVTGIVDLKTWKEMGYTESQWYSLGQYVSPIGVDIDSTRTDCIEAMIDRAYAYLGDDYIIGASGAPGLGCDCSGLVMQSLYAAGIDMGTITPVSHAQPGHEYESVNIWNSSKFKHVSYSSRQRGDLIVYSNANGNVNHIAIYLGGDRVIESYPNKVVISYITSSLHTHVKGVIRPFV